ncbi:MAG: hypothetical protein DRQ43_09035 [Gammaproteobacteria bacterium]|nr:MAG: hypothetical protein DRQ43_09035 [Gammaproteobacteria bacterium]
MKKSTVFEETCQQYLAQIRQVDFLAKAEILGVNRDKDRLIIPLYDRIYSLSAEGLSEKGGGKITPAVQVMIYKYILTCGSNKPAMRDKMVTYREFKDSGPLISYFTTNTNKTLESTFSGNIELLKERSQKRGGELLTSDMYDLSIRFYAFPKIPVVINFNDSDELFPSKSSVLYRSTAEHYLDMECLAMTGTLLVGKLISS